MVYHELKNLFNWKIQECTRTEKAFTSSNVHESPFWSPVLITSNRHQKGHFFKRISIGIRSSNKTYAPHWSCFINLPAFHRIWDSVSRTSSSGLWQAASWSRPAWSTIELMPFWEECTFCALQPAFSTALMLPCSSSNNSVHFGALP